MHAKNWIQLGATAAIFALAEAAFAIPLTLTGPVANNSVGPQSASAPCVIAATNCSQPANFGFNNFSANGNTSSYNMYSPMMKRYDLTKRPERYRQEPGKASMPRR